MRKALRIIGFVAIVFLGILIIFYSYLKIKFPPEKVQALILQQARAQLNRNITAKSLRIHPFSGFELRGLVLYDSESVKSLPFATLKSLQFKYRLLSVFKKKIEIKKIEVVEPSLFLRRNRDGFWNFGDLISSRTDSLTTSTSPSSGTEIPGFVKNISFNLQEFLVQDAKIQADIEDSLGNAVLKIGPVSVQLDQFLLSKIDPETILKNLTFRLSVYSGNGNLGVKVTPKNSIKMAGFALRKIELSGKWTLQMLLQKSAFPDSGKIDSTSFHSSSIQLTNAFNLQPVSVRLLGNRSSAPGSLTQIINYLPEVRTGFRGTVAMEKPSADFSDIHASVGSFLHTAFQITADSLATAPEAEISFKRGNLNLKRLMAYLKNLPLLGDNPFKKVRLSGMIDFSKIQAHAKLGANHLRVRYRFEPMLKNVSAFIPGIAARIANFSANALASGEIADSAFVRGQLRASFALPEVSAAPAESLQINGKNLIGAAYFSLGKNLVPKKFNLSFSADSLLGSQISSYSEFRVANVSNLQDLGIEDFDGSTEFQIKNLVLDGISGGSARGHVNASGLLIANYGMNAFFQTIIHSNDIQYLYAPRVFESLPEILFSGKGNLKSSSGFKKVSISNFRLKVNDFVHGVVQAAIYPLQQKAEIHLRELIVDLSKIRPYLPSDILETLQFADWNGSVGVQADAQASLDSARDSLLLTTKGRVNVAIPYFIDSQMLLNINGLTLQTDFSGNPENMEALFQGDVKSAFLKDVLARAAQNTHFEGRASIEDFDRIRLKNFHLLQPDLHADVQAKGNVDSLSSSFPLLNIAGIFQIDSEQSFPALVGISMDGKLTGKFHAKSDSLSPKAVYGMGEVNLQGFNVDIENTATFRGIHGKIPFRIGVDIESGLLLPSQHNMQVSLPLYTVFQPYYFEADSLFQTICVDTISVLNYNLTNLRSDIRVENGTVLLPNTQINLYDGNLVSQIWLNLGTGQLKDVSYEIRAQMARVNSAKFPGSRNRRKQQSQIAASVHFKGRGLDTAKGLDVQGGVEVTEIGPATTDNLLRSLDPQGLDKSIQQVRQLIRFGAKPKLISFSIRHGNLYPTILLTQPWYYPFKISGGRVSLVRIPLSFVLNMALQSTEPIL